jgi:hypothetical protein
LPTNFSEFATDICGAALLIWFFSIIWVIGMDHLRTLRRAHRPATRTGQKPRQRSGLMQDF